MTRMRHTLVMMFALWLVIAASPALVAAQGAPSGSYRSATYGFALTWDPWWSFAATTSRDGTDTLVLHDGLARATFVANRAFAGDPNRCLDTHIADLVTSPDYTGVRAMRDEHGLAVGLRSSTAAYATLYLQPAASPPGSLEQVVFVKCWRMTGDGVLALRFEARADLFATEAPLMALLLERLILPMLN